MTHVGSQRDLEQNRRWCRRMEKRLGRCCPAIGPSPQSSSGIHDLRDSRIDTRCPGHRHRYPHRIPFQGTLTSRHRGSRVPRFSPLECLLHATSSSNRGTDLQGSPRDGKAGVGSGCVGPVVRAQGEDTGGRRNGSDRRRGDRSTPRGFVSEDRWPAPFAWQTNLEWPAAKAVPS